MREYQEFIENVTKLFKEKYNLVLIERNQLSKHDDLFYPFATFITNNIEPNSGTPCVDNDGITFIGVKAEITFSVYSRSNQAQSIAAMLYCYFKATRDFNIYTKGGIRNESLLLPNGEYVYKYSFDCVFNFNHILDKVTEFIEPEKVPVEIAMNIQEETEETQNSIPSFSSVMENVTTAFDSLNKLTGVKVTWK